MSNNQDKLNEQLFNVIANNKDSDEAKLKKIKYLVYLGADVHQKYKYEDTALMVAAYNGHLDVVKYLIKQGANLEAKDKDGKTALMKAAASGKLDVVKCLAECGADLEVKDKDGDMALDHARMWGKADCLKFLEELQQKGESKVEVLSEEEKNTTVKKRGIWQRMFGGRD